MKTNNLNTFQDLINLRKTNTIRRYSLEHIIKDHTVSSHSFWVALIALHIFEEVREYYAVRNTALHREKILLYALFHDLPEPITDDIDYHVKKKLIDKEKENELIESYFSTGMYSKYLKYMKEPETEEEKSIEYRIMKLADITEHFLYCYEEVAIRGNKGLREPIEDVIDIYTNTPIEKEISTHSHLLRTVITKMNELIDETDWAL